MIYFRFGIRQKKSENFCKSSRIYHCETKAKLSLATHYLHRSDKPPKGYNHGRIIKYDIDNTSMVITKRIENNNNINNNNDLK